jgi:hypothetical protein
MPIGASSQQSVYLAPPRFQFRSLWGQFLQRDGAVREEPAAEFQQRVSRLCAASDAAACFPYQVLGARSDLREFFAFCDI